MALVNPVYFSLPHPLPSPKNLNVIADNKFSSFVRQLNFYGFRKVKSNIAVEGHDSKWWEFKVRDPTVNTVYLEVSAMLLDTVTDDGPEDRW